VDDGKSYVLSVALAIGDVLLMSNYDDICPKVIHTSLAGQLLLVTESKSSRSFVLLSTAHCFCAKTVCCRILENVTEMQGATESAACDGML